MGEYCSDEKCCDPKQECCPAESQEGFADWFLEIADEAWTEVLKEKIKEHILSTQNDRMTELAKIVSEGNNERWKSKMQKKQSFSDFQERLYKFFSSHKK